jgi:hypothetical protein
MKSCVIVQGKIYKSILSDLLNTYKDIPDKIISTWDTEDLECINILRENGFEIIIQSIPEICNASNYQGKSMIGGILHAKKLGYTHALRIRADVKCNNMLLFISLLEKKYYNKLSFMAFHRNIPNISEPYLLDHFIYGNLEDQYNYWNICQEKNDTRYCEKFLQETYFGKIDITYDDIKDKIFLFIEDARELGIEFYYTKPQYITHPELIKNYLLRHSRC